MSKQATLQDLVQELAQTRGLDFRGYKPGTLERRLQKRLSELHLTSYDAYLEYFHGNPQEIDEVLRVVLINVTQFFRDPPAWECLRKDAFPELLKNLKPGDTFRAWSAGCATGEEVYSLAILLAEHFGDGLKDYDFRLYATDHDESALNVARRGEYKADALRHVPAEWRQRYFTGENTMRLNREIRKLVIFGRSNLVSDAPISHVQLILCRNVLIYFDLPLQRRVMESFSYALEDKGILFLGKAESQLRGTAWFKPLNAKWRIFQLRSEDKMNSKEHDEDRAYDIRTEFESLAQRSILNNIGTGLVILDAKTVIQVANDSALQMWDLLREAIIGKKLRDTPLLKRCPGLSEALDRKSANGPEEVVRVEVEVGPQDEARSLSVTVAPLLNGAGVRVGTVIYSEDVTANQKLRSIIGELETTGEELHATNEELETTNEELQSTNEELETTNEELQSTNEELETTNEELHSLNQELETTNSELQQRTRELDEVTKHYGGTLSHLPTPLILANDDGTIAVWNKAAERFFGLEARAVVGLKLRQVPFTQELGSALRKRHQTAVRTQTPNVVRNVLIKANNFRGSVDVHLTPVAGIAIRGILITLDPFRTGKLAERAAERRSVLARGAIASANRHGSPSRGHSGRRRRIQKTRKK